jgi:hypothetical protein
LKEVILTLLLGWTFFEVVVSLKPETLYAADLFSPVVLLLLLFSDELLRDLSAKGPLVLLLTGVI